NLSNEQRENLEVSQTSARSLVTIINDILDFSKVEQGKMELLPEFVELRSLLVLLDKLFLDRGRKKGVDFTPVIDGRVPSHVIVDSERLKQVLINLVENAIKFTPEGGFVMLHVLVEEIRDNKVDLLFAVADTGIGIHEDKREKIFESFTQAEQYTTRKYGGTGLGLAISSQIVNLMGGTLKVDSKEGVGSRFYFHLTLDIPPHVEVRNRVDLVIENHDDNDSSFDSLNLNILLAEDNSVNQKLFLKLLEKFGCNVSVVANGRLVLEQLQNSSFDLVLMDCQMPEMDGYEATKCIRQGEGSSDVHLPIIALTAHALESDRDRCLAVGMDDYLCKPVDKKALYKALSKVAEKRS
ncbi:MAG: response regulator, partial [Deltaproteobacteria bacterium]|nr:response regulator [Deltaproteobacteria bacterium]